jgi:hypothetical protein
MSSIFRSPSPRFVFLLGLNLVISLAHGQTAVNQEQLQRERERALRQQQEQRPDVNLGTPANSAMARISRAGATVPQHHGDRVGG